MSSRRLSVKAKASFAEEDDPPTKAPRTASVTEDEEEDDKAQVELAATAPMEGGAGAKASADTAAPGHEAAQQEVPPEQLLWEVQRLLHISDLEQTTVGQIRTALEERMGMDRGALTSRKTLRRQFSNTVQEEVVKKQQRSHDCNIVMQAVAQLDDYPMRQMLLQSLPHAMVGGSSSSSQAVHAHQLQLLGIVREAVAEARAVITAAGDEREAQKEAAVAKRPSLEEACAAAAAAAAEAEAFAESAAALARGLQDEVSAAHAQVSRAESACENAGEVALSLRSRRDAAEQMRDQQLRSLLAGEWEDDEGLKSTLEPVVSYLKEEECELPLLLAAEAALQLRPEARGMFDKLSLRALDEFINEHLASAAKRLDAGVEFMAEAEHLAAKAMLGAVQERAEAQELDWHKAQTIVDERGRLLAGAEAELALLDASVKPLMVEDQSVQRLAGDLDKALAVLDRTMSSGSCPAQACPAVADNDNDASDDAHVDVECAAKVEAEVCESHVAEEAGAFQPLVPEEHAKMDGSSEGTESETCTKSEM